MPDTITLYRPVGPEELELIKNLDWKAFPPRLAQQPIFYPVLNEQYAAQIAREWNVPASGSGYVTRFNVDKSYIDRFEPQNVGGPDHNEIWIPAEALPEFNKHIVGVISIVTEFHGDRKK